MRDDELLVPLGEEWDWHLRSSDPLDFRGYADALASAPGESVRTGVVEVRGTQAVLVQSDFDVFGGTMGAVAGEKVVRAFRRAIDRRLPVVAVTQTGGARVQEGMASLIQMPRTVALADEHARSGLASAVVYRSPTTGGVYASWASLLSARAAEPRATLGFAGPRVIEQTMGQLPTTCSHTAEGAYQAGLIDALLKREDQVKWVAAVIGSGDWPFPPIDSSRIPSTAPCAAPASARQAIDMARSSSRPSGLEWASALCTSWVELRGQDPTIRAGLARILHQRLVVVFMDRHANGSGSARPKPSGFRLARRAVALANNLGIPLLTIVDTPGADSAPAAEQGGIALEIAMTLRSMARLGSPSICVCVGEGGSGGAMALSHTDRLFMLPSSVFSVISPEGAAAILFRDASKAGELAGALRLTCGDLIRLGIVDGALAELSADRIVNLRLGILESLRSIQPGDRDRRIGDATATFIRNSP